MLGIADALIGDDRLGQPAVDELLAARLARAQHVEADAADDRGQPGADVVDFRGVGTAQPQPRLLNGVVGLGHRPEHPLRDRP